MEAKFLGDNKRELRRNDGDGNENGKKAIGLDKQNNNFACASRFFVHLLAVIATTAHKNFLFLFVNLDTVLSDSTLKFRQHLSN